MSKFDAAAVRRKLREACKAGDALAHKSDANKVLSSDDIPSEWKANAALERSFRESFVDTQSFLAKHPKSRRS